MLRRFKIPTPGVPKPRWTNSTRVTTGVKFSKIPHFSFSSEDSPEPPKLPPREEDPDPNSPPDPLLKPYLRNFYLTQTIGVGGVLAGASILSGYPINLAAAMGVGAPFALGGYLGVRYQNSLKQLPNGQFKIPWTTKISFLANIIGSALCLSPLVWAFDVATPILITSFCASLVSTATIFYQNKTPPQLLKTPALAPIAGGLITITALNLTMFAFGGLLDAGLVEFCQSSLMASLIGGWSIYLGVGGWEALKQFEQGGRDFLKLGVKRYVGAVFMLVEFLVELIGYFLEVIAGILSAF